MTTTAADNEQKSSAVAAEIVRRARLGRATLGRVLDVGCGTGSVLFASRARATSLCGVDLRDEFLNAARASLPDAELSNASAERLPFADASFDTIFFCDVIEHLHDPVAPLREIRRVLAPRGVFVVTTPNSNALLRYALRAAWPALADPTHILFFTRFTLRHLLKMTGFTPAHDGTLGGSGIVPVNAVLEAFGNGGTIVSISRA